MNQQRQMRRPNLMDWHSQEPWTRPDYQDRFNQAKDSGFFGLGMINPNTNKFMYDATDLSNINDYYFCFDTVDLIVGFIENCVTHSKPNRFAKFPLHISQKKFYANVFGWRRLDNGRRRYMECLRYVPRKNSKTFDISCLIHIGMLFDDPNSAEIYSVAANKEQAKLIQSAFVGTIKNDQERPDLCTGGWLDRTYSIHGVKDVKAVTASNGACLYKALASDDNASHGLNTSYGLYDEIHAHKDQAMYDVIQTSMGVREQPLSIAITTADFARVSFCNRKLDYAKRVCKDPSYDETFLPILYYADEEEFGDDWNDPLVWKRVNPMLGTAKQMHVMEREYKQAKNEPVYANAFKRLHLNICTKSESSAYDISMWNKCLYLPDEQFKLLNQPIPEFLRDAKCYGGFDCAYKWDLSAFVLDFPEHEYVLAFCWINSKHKEIVQYKQKFGNWLLTSGQDETDFEKVAEQMNKIYEVFNIQDVGFDPNQSRELVKILENDKNNNWECYNVAQNARNLSEPIKHTISAVEACNINHNGNELFSWQLSNCDVKEDSNQNYMFVKPKGIDARIRKIDAGVALAMARARRLEGEEKATNTYVDRFKETGQYF